MFEDDEVVVDSLTVIHNASSLSTLAAETKVLGVSKVKFQMIQIWRRAGHAVDFFPPIRRPQLMSQQV
jgi:hypothetical protein